MIEENDCKYRVKTRARDFTHLLAKSGILSAVITLVTGEAKGKEMTAERVGPSFAGDLPGTLVVSGYLLS